MTNTSRTGGYLTPPAGSPAPAYDDALDDIFQRHAVGVTGLPANMVRPRWQERPPVQPSRETNWCSIGVKSIPNKFGPALIHIGTDASNPDDGEDVREWQEEIEVIASFYGPNALNYASLLIDGCGIPQNNDQLAPYQIAFITATNPVAAPDFVNQQWIRRFDTVLTFRRKTQRTYLVRNLADAQINLDRN